MVNRFLTPAIARSAYCARAHRSGQPRICLSFSSDASRHQSGPGGRRLSRIPRVSDVLARDAVLDTLKLSASAA